MRDDETDSARRGLVYGVLAGSMLWVCIVLGYVALTGSIS